ncbi:sensor histidine kinase [Streptomyces tirandamycinicus]|uniref:sensor histidine kinase n=1 Tax=Streptomyces tirandamycinicus TaxID=2174846 RepID=UPI001FC99EE5|nr:histidine kinase [Streptomyces tirandamycinicus]
MRWPLRCAAVRKRARPAADVAVAVALALTTAVQDGRSANFAYADWIPPLWLAVPLGLLTGAAAWRRRRHPKLFLLCALGSYVALSSWVAVMVAQYTVAERSASWRKAAPATVAALVIVAVPVWDMGGADAAVPISLGICLLPTLLGLYVGAHRALLAELRERAERAEREQHQRVLQARSDERTRIARDMHDVVTHRVSLIVLHATALEAARGETALTLGRQIGTIGREALTELRSLVEVLRSDTEVPLAPQPGLAELDDLVGESRRTGIPVTLTMTDGTGATTESGSPAMPVLPALVEHAVYRVVQEALTNVHKHAGDAETRVEVRHTPGLLRLTVTNRRGTAEGTTDLPGGGHGLLGIAERIRLLGGRLTAQPMPGGGFGILAEIPLDGTPPTAHTAEGPPATESAR